MKRLAAAGLFLIGCATGPSVTLNPNYDFSTIKRIAVLGFDSAAGHDSSGRSFSAIFERHLIAQGFDLVERRDVEKILKEQHFEMSGAVDSSQAIEIGKLLGVDALVGGQITVYEPHRSSIVMVDVESVSKEPVIRKREIVSLVDGKQTTQVVSEVVDYKVTKEVEQRPQVYRVQAESGAVVKMVDARNGSLIWVGSDTEEGVNIHTASELVASRIMVAFQKARKEKNK